MRKSLRLANLQYLCGEEAAQRSALSISEIRFIAKLKMILQLQASPDERLAPVVAFFVSSVTI